MILLYHKISSEARTQWWVTANTFFRQLVELSDKKFVYLDDYNPEDDNQVVITFDGVYSDVLQYAAPILKSLNLPFELFITEDYIGKNNEFDKVEPDSQFADQAQLKKLVEFGGRLQWHTKTHRHIKVVKDEELEREIICPEKFKSLDPQGFKWFAYAHGEFDSRAKSIVKNNFKGGLACENGSWKDNSIWPRKTITEKTILSTKKVSVLIPCYNYAHFLVEAVESVLRQTYLPDEIILSDDASTDHTLSIMRSFQRKYPELIRVNSNKENLGIEKHFRKIIDLAKGDYICFLGADNRIQSNYIEKCYRTLSKDKNTAIAYTDFMLFGNRAVVKSRDFMKTFKVKKHEFGVFSITFPAFGGKPVSTNTLKDRNFVHGSSMYKKAAYLKVGGYDSRTKGHEDRQLFNKILNKGYTARKVPGVFLEYRQHSTEQANQQFAYYSELTFLRNEIKHREVQAQEIKILKENEARLRKTLSTITNSRYWKMRKYYIHIAQIIKLPKRILRKIKRLMKGSR
jgi:glycosyltransferase involved in cell wall biosynthesis